MSPSPPPPRVPDLVWMMVVTALVVGLLWTVPIAAARDADGVHLWLGGHTLVRAGAAALYDPIAQLSLLSSAFGGAVPDDLWAGRNDLLGAFFYPPPAALLYAPVGLLPVHTATLVLPVVSLVAFLGAGGLLSRVTGLRPFAAVGATLLVPAVFHCHVLGQNGGLALLVLAGASLALCRGRNVLAGVILGALAVKPSWWIAVAWVPLVLGRPRLMLGFGASTAALCLGASAVLGAQPWLDWLALAPDIARLAELPDYPLHLQYSLPGVGRRLLSGAWGARLGGVLAVGALAVGAWKTRALATADLPRALCMAWATASLISPHAHAYDVVGALPGLLLLGARRGLHPAVIVLAVVHHGGQALEGGQGTGWALPPATLGLIAVWLALGSDRLYSSVDSRS